MSAAHQAVFDRVLAMPPVDTTYVAGRWHHDRVALGGYVIEARILLKSLTVPRNRNKRFLIIGRARSGTTLLTRLLNSHSSDPVRWRGPPQRKRAVPRIAAGTRLAGKSSAPVYGAKSCCPTRWHRLHRMRDPHGFLARFIFFCFFSWRAPPETAFVLNPLATRHVLQTLSADTYAQKNGKQFHSDKGAKRPERRGRAPGSGELRHERLSAWSLALLEYEDAPRWTGLDHR